MNFKLKSVLGLLLCSGTAFAAQPYYTENPGSLYPPSCVSGPLRELDLTGENAVRFFSDRIWLETAQRIESSDPFANLGKVQLDMYRVGCSEADRSLVIAEFSLPPEWVDPRKSQLLLPWMGGSTGFDPVPFEFKPEANSWGQSPGQFHYTQRALGDYTGGWDNARRFTWRYILDSPSQDVAWGRDGGATWYYNGQFGLMFFRSHGDNFLSVLVPSTENLLEPAEGLPLSGRLSGNWVEDGTGDQGLLLSFSTAPPPRGLAEPWSQSKMVLFLSWFTFDTDGEMLWITGAAQFTQGAREVTVTIERVETGTFLSENQGTGIFNAGTATLRAINCNLIEIEYDLDALGLGRDTMQLQRLQAMEIADYACRDYPALRASIYPSEPY
jgi:hypothetical protein